MIDFFTAVFAWMDDPVRREFTGPITYFLVICIPGAIMFRRMFDVSWWLAGVPIYGVAPLIIAGWVLPKPVLQVIAVVGIGAYALALLVALGFLLIRRRATDKEA